MGNSLSSRTTTCLEDQLRQNDPNLVSLELLQPPETIIQNLSSFFHAMKRNRTVQTVVLMDNFADEISSNEEQWECFLNALVSMPSLTQVELYDTSVSPTSICKLLSNVPTLQALLICDGIVDVTVDDLNALAQAITVHGSLHEFVLRFDSQNVAAQFENSNPEATATTASSHKRKSLQSAPLDRLFQSLSTLPHLKTLTISNTSMSPVTKPLVSQAALKEFFDQSRGKLESIEFSGLGWTDQHMEAMAYHLSGTIQDNNCKGMPLSSSSLLSSTLTRLVVLRNPSITCQGYDYLLQMLDTNVCIRDVTTDAPEVIQNKIEFMTYLNRHGRGNILKAISLKSRRMDWYILLLNFSSNPDAIFYYLREFPTLWN